METVSTVRFTKVVHVTDSYIKVRLAKGKVVTITAPYDKSVNMDEPFSGEGTIQCPTSLTR